MASTKDTSSSDEEENLFLKNSTAIRKDVPPDLHTTDITKIGDEDVFGSGDQELEDTPLSARGIGVSLLSKTRLSQDTFQTDADAEAELSRLESKLNSLRLSSGKNITNDADSLRREFLKFSRYMSLLDKDQFDDRLDKALKDLESLPTRVNTGVRTRLKSNAARDLETNQRRGSIVMREMIDKRILQLRQEVSVHHDAANDDTDQAQAKSQDKQNDSSDLSAIHGFLPTSEGFSHASETLIAKVNRIEKEVKDIPDLWLKLEANISVMGKLHESIDGFVSEISEYKQEVKDMNYGQGLTQSKYSEIDKKADELSDQHASLSAEVQEMNKNLKAISDKIAPLSEEQILAKVRLTMDEQFSEMEARITASHGLTPLDLQKAITKTNSLQRSFKCIDEDMKDLRKATSELQERSSLSYSTSSETTRRNAEAQRKHIEENIAMLVEELAKKTSLVIDSDTPEMLIKECQKVRAPDLQKIISNTQEQVSRYFRLDDVNQDIVDKAQSTVKNVKKWLSQVTERYDSLQIYSMEGVKNIGVEVKPFEAKGDQNVFEFLKDFETLTYGWPDNLKAELMHKKYLSKFIKAKTVSLESNYKKLREFLVENYGDGLDIIEAIISDLEDKGKPTSNSYKHRAEYFTTIIGAIRRIEKLCEYPSINDVDVKRNLHSKATLKRLIKLLTPADRTNFYRQADEDLDPKRMRGPDALKEYLNFCSKECTALEEADDERFEPSKANKDKGKKSVHSVHSQKAQSSDTEGEENSVHNISKTSGAKKKAQTGWYNERHKFPCGLQGHNHEVGKCAEFFSSTAKERRMKVETRICWSCLGPREKCLKRCVNEIPEGLICNDCKRNAAGRTPLQVLMCTNTSHTKPNITEISELLEQRYPGYTRSVMDNAVVLSANFAVACESYFGKVEREKGTGSLRESVSTPNIDTVTGKRTEVDPSLIRKEPKERSFYIMQWLRIGERDCLCFFDRGANINLIKADVAEQANLPIISNRPTALSGVGGGSVDAAYGTYQLVMGSENSGSWHQLTCSGIGSITRKCNKYDLSPINTEARRHIAEIDDQTTLPNTIGGCEVDLLLGIKDVSLDPVLLGMLPSGVGVYRSPFTDKNGSRICYGGPHEVFSRMSAESDESINSVMFIESLNESRMSTGSLLTEEIPWISNEDMNNALIRKVDNVITVDTVINFKVSPTPLTTEDFIAAGCDPDLEESDDMKAERCAMKAKLPLAKQKVVLDQVRINNTMTYRCMLCSTCQVCTSTEVKNVVKVDNMAQPAHTLNATGDAHDESACTSTKEDSRMVNDNSWVMKATMPMAKQRVLLDQDDVGDLITYRCPKCSKCQRCKESPRTKAVSMQESIEQQVIEESVQIDHKNKKVMVNLPFMQDPVDYLAKIHNGSDNKRMAVEVYKSQCRKQEDAKIGMRKVHEELVQKGFMKKMTDIDPNLQEKILQAQFRHYYPWRIQYKEDSLSTPVRLVVDPTMTGLNNILAKGENRLGNIVEIFIRNRSKEFIWSSDISKLYNQLHLQEDALPYSLFLYHSSLDPTVPPDVYVMLVAWYGVTPTGAQADYALQLIAEEHGDNFPEAIEPIRMDRYVDDLTPGASTAEKRESQISQTQTVIAKAGFQFKHVTRSGEAPSEKASADGVSTKLLGYNWLPKEDLLGLGMSELNFNKKIRGAKKANSFPITCKEDAKRLMDPLTFTRQIVVAKCAEFYDPLGLLEPIKMQLKLELSKLNSYQWKEELPEAIQKEWKERFLEYLEYPKVMLTRSVIPTEASGESKIRLLCLSDAGKSAGGCAIYAGCPLNDGSFSCQLLTSKSKLMNGTVPRNELSAIVMMTELAYICKKALKEEVGEIVYVTDSTIALSWCTNMSIKLRLYVHNRVETIRRMIEWTVGENPELPLFHISGKLNIADLLTKPHCIGAEDMKQGGSWQSGLPWMKLPTAEMPLKKYSDLTIDHQAEKEISEECFDVPFMLETEGVHPLIAESLQVFHLMDETDNYLHDQAMITSTRRRDQIEEPPVDIVYHGWSSARRILGNMIRYNDINHHKSGTLKCLTNCISCKYGVGSEEAQRQSDIAAEEQYFRYETEVINHVMPEQKRKQFIMKNGILCFTGRITDDNQFRFKDLDLVPFFDNTEVVGVVPVVLSDSPVFAAYLMEVHNIIRPHAGVERTLSEIMKKMYVPNNPRRIIRKVIADCPKCIMIRKKTIEMEMAKQHFSRTFLAPPFYHSMIDIAYGFNATLFKNARRTYKIYPLVIVCLLTSATSIMVMEGVETQDVVIALTRHACLHGVPSHVFVDNGTQLVALGSVKFSIRDLNAYVYDAMRMKVSVSNAKSHEERGRVERRIRHIRDTLKSTADHHTTAQTALQWETLFAKVANTINDLPIAKGNCSNVNDLGFEMITPNRLLLGRNNFRSLEGPGMVIESNNIPSRLLEKNREIYRTWYQFYIDRIHHLTMKPLKWSLSSERQPKPQDIVFFVFNDSALGKDWRLGRVVQVSENGRQVTIEYTTVRGSQQASKKQVTRSPRDITILFSVEEVYLNSRKYFKQFANEQADPGASSAPENLDDC